MSDMSSMLKLIAPNTMGGSAKGGQTAPPAAADPNAPGPAAGGQPTATATGSTLMPVANPMAWTRAGSGNFTPGSTNKGGMMKMMGGTGGGG